MSDKKFDVNVSFRDVNNSLRDLLRQATADLNSLQAQVGKVATDTKTKLITDRTDIGKAGSTKNLAYQPAVDAVTRRASELAGLDTAVTMAEKRVEQAFDTLLAGKDSRDPDKFKAAVTQSEELIRKEIDALEDLKTALAAERKRLEAQLQGLAAAGPAEAVDLIKQINKGYDPDSVVKHLVDEYQKTSGAKLNDAQTKQLAAAMFQGGDIKATAIPADFLKSYAGLEVDATIKGIESAAHDLTEIGKGLGTLAFHLDPFGEEIDKLAGGVKQLGKQAVLKNGQDLSRMMPLMRESLARLGLAGDDMESVFDHLSKYVDKGADMAIQSQQAQQLLNMAAKRARQLVEQGTRLNMGGDDLNRFVTEGMKDFDFGEELTQKHLRDSIRDGEDRSEMESFRNAASVFGLNQNDPAVLAELGKTGLMTTIENFRGLMVNTWANMIAGIATEVIMNVGIVVAETYKQVGDLRKQIDQFPEPKNIEQIQKTALGAAAGFENGLQTVTGFVKQLKELDMTADASVQVLEKLASAARTSGADLKETTQAYLTMVQATGSDTSVDVSRGVGVFAQNKVNETLAAEKYSQLAKSQAAVALSYEELIILSAHYAKENLAVGDSIQTINRDLQAAKGNIENTEAPLKSAAEGAASLSAQWTTFLASLKHGEFDEVFSGMAFVASAFLKTLQAMNDLIRDLNELTGGWGTKFMAVLGAMTVFGSIATALTYVNSQALEFRNTLGMIQNLLSMQVRNAEAATAATVAGYQAQEGAAKKTAAAMAGVNAAQGTGAAAAAMGTGLIDGVNNAMKRGAWKIVTGIGTLFMRAIPLVNFALIGGTIISMVWNAIKGRSEALKQQAEAEARARQAEAEAQAKKEQAYLDGVKTMDEVLGGDWSVENLGRYIAGELDNRIKMLGLSVENVKKDFSGMVDSAKALGSPLQYVVDQASQIAAKMEASKAAMQVFQDAKNEQNAFKLGGGSELFNVMFEQQATENAYDAMLQKIDGTIVGVKDAVASGNQLAQTGNASLNRIDGSTYKTAYGKTPETPASKPKTNAEVDTTKAVAVTAVANFMQWLKGQPGAGSVRLPAWLTGGDDQQKILAHAKVKNVSELTRLPVSQVRGAVQAEVTAQQRLIDSYKAQIQAIQKDPNKRPSPQDQNKIDALQKLVTQAAAERDVFKQYLESLDKFIKSTQVARPDVAKTTSEERFDFEKAVQALMGNESSGGKDTFNELSGARGVLQIMPEYWKDYWERAAQMGMQIKPEYEAAARKGTGSGPWSDRARRDQILNDPETQKYAFKAVYEGAFKEAAKMGKTISAMEAFYRAQVKWYTGSYRFKDFATMDALLNSAKAKTPVWMNAQGETMYSTDRNLEKQGWVRQPSISEYLERTRSFLEEAGYGPRSVNATTSQTGPAMSNAEVIKALTALPYKMTTTFGQRYSFKATDGKQVNATHYGEDFAAPEGTKLFAPFAGKLKLKWDEELGNYVDLVDALGNTLRLGHLSDATKELIKQLQQTNKDMIVQKGQLIAFTGNTGKWTTGPHLHKSTFKAGSNLRFGSEANPNSVQFVGMDTKNKIVPVQAAPQPLTKTQSTALLQATDQAKLANERAYNEIAVFKSNFNEAKDARLQALKDAQTAAQNEVAKKYNPIIEDQNRPIKEREQARRDATKALQDKRDKLQADWQAEEVKALETYYSQLLTMVKGFFKSSPNKAIAAEYQKWAEYFTRDVRKQVTDARGELAKLMATDIAEISDEEKKDPYGDMMRKLLGVRDDTLRAKKVDPLSAAITNFQDELAVNGKDMGLTDKQIRSLDLFAERLKRVTAGVTRFRTSLEAELDENKLLQPVERITSSLVTLEVALMDQKDAYDKFAQDFEKAKTPQDREYARAQMQAASNNADLIRQKIAETNKEAATLIQQQVVSAVQSSKTLMADYRQTKAQLAAGNNESMGILKNYQFQVDELTRSFDELSRLSQDMHKYAATAATKATNAMAAYNRFLQLQLDVTKQIYAVEKQLRDLRTQQQGTLFSRSIEGGDAAGVKTQVSGLLGNDRLQPLFGQSVWGKAVLGIMNNLKQSGVAANGEEGQVLAGLPEFFKTVQGLFGPDSQIAQVEAVLKEINAGGFKFDGQTGEQIAKSFKKEYDRVAQKLDKDLTGMEKTFKAFYESGDGQDMLKVLTNAGQNPMNVKALFGTLLDRLNKVASQSIENAFIGLLPANSDLLKLTEQRGRIQAELGASQSALSAQMDTVNQLALNPEGGSLFDAVFRAQQLEMTVLTQTLTEKNLLVKEIEAEGDNAYNKETRLTTARAEVRKAKQDFDNALVRMDEVALTALSTRAGAIGDAIDAEDFSFDATDAQKLKEAPALMQGVQDQLRSFGDLMEAATLVQDPTKQKEALATVRRLGERFSARLKDVFSTVAETTFGQVDEEMAKLDLGVKDGSVAPEEFRQRVDGLLGSLNGLLGLAELLPEAVKQKELDAIKARLAKLNLADVEAYARKGIEDADAAYSKATNDPQRAGPLADRIAARSTLLAALQMQYEKGKTSGMSTEDLTKLGDEIKKLGEEIQGLTQDKKKLDQTLRFDALQSGVAITDKLTRSLNAARKAYEEFMDTGLEDTASVQQAMIDVLDAWGAKRDEGRLPTVGTDFFRSQQEQRRAYATALDKLSLAEQLQAASGNVEAFGQLFEANFGRPADEFERQMWASGAATAALRDEAQKLSFAVVVQEAERLNRILQDMLGNVRAGFKDILSIPRKMAEQQRQLEQAMRGHAVNLGVNSLNREEVEREITRLKEKLASATSQAEYDATVQSLSKWEEKLVDLRLEQQGLNAAMQQSQDQAKSWTDMLLQSLQGVLDRFTEMVETMSANELMKGIFGQSADDGSFNILRDGKNLIGMARGEGMNSMDLLGSTPATPMYVSDVSSGLPGSGLPQVAQDLFGGLTGIQPIGEDGEPLNIDPAPFGVTYKSALGEFGAATDTGLDLLGGKLSADLDGVKGAVLASGAGKGGGLSLGGFDPASILLNIGLQVGMMLLGQAIDKFMNAGEKSKGFKSDGSETKGTRNPNRAAVAVTINTTDEQAIRRETDRSVGRALRRTRYFE